MPTAKDVRDILDIPAAPPADPPAGNSFNLKQPPPGRGVSFVTNTVTDTHTAASTTLPPPATTPVGKGIAENLSAAERHRKSRGDGMVRELFSLIGDNAPSLAQVRRELELEVGTAEGTGSGKGKGKGWRRERGSGGKW
jgi:hypothetical protein